MVLNKALKWLKKLVKRKKNISTKNNKKSKKLVLI